jgi:hypothetical protein
MWKTKKKGSFLFFATLPAQNSIFCDVHKCAPWLLQFLTFFFFSIAFPQISDFSWKMKGSAFSSFPCAF